MSFKLSALALVIVGLTGCGQGFQAASTSNASGSTSNGSSGISTPTTAQDAFKALAVDGTVNGGSDSTTQVIQIDKTNMQLVARLPVPLGTLDGMAVAPISIRQIPGATLGMETTADGGSALTLRIPLSSVINGIKTLPPGRLPNGDPLPAVADGELPEVAIQLSNLGNLNGAVYLAPSEIGLFVEAPFNPYIGLTFPIKNAARTRTWGYFSSIPVKGTYKGGFFMSLALPDDIARMIDDVM